MSKYSINLLSGNETKITMNKGTKKSKSMRYDADALKVVSIKYGISQYYIRQSVSGLRKGLVPDKLKAEYNEAVKELGVAREEAIKKLTKV